MSLTTNKNFLSPNGFRLTIDSKDFADVEYFCTRSPLPDVSAGSISQAFRNRPNSFPGEKVEYAPLAVSYMVTENMENYIALFNWMVSNANDGQIRYADVILSILNSSNNLIRQVRFVDAFPSALGAIDFHTQNTDVEYVTGDATFTYSNFEFIK
jgi:hypothetical protein